MVPETYISFYLRSNKIHVFVDALRGIGSPKYICFMVKGYGQSIAVTPYEKKDFKSHRVPRSVYAGADDMEVTSIRLCKMMSEIYHWDANQSYRVPGFVLDDRTAAIFNPSLAEPII